ncbi:S24/S26 family peptidase [Salinispora vitiensis]|uniref:S24/S26 family peptidase n=1 Tax=Salinispora vitiensis TaxID=999544 RepID=UPI00039E1578|nr:S24/S26 family peptidase [Salinispora vitiensis]
MIEHDITWRPYPVEVNGMPPFPPCPAPGARWTLSAVLVTGPSMAPTLRHGDAVLVRRGERGIRAGDVVVAVFRSRPDLLVVKRAIGPTAEGWWLVGDNPLITDDSRAYGGADIWGRVVARYWPRPRLLRRHGV